MTRAVCQGTAAQWRYNKSPVEGTRAVALRQRACGAGSWPIKYNQMYTFGTSPVPPMALVEACETQEKQNGCGGKAVLEGQHYLRSFRSRR